MQYFTRIATHEVGEARDVRNERDSIVPITKYNGVELLSPPIIYLANGVMTAECEQPAFASQLCQIFHGGVER